MTRKIEDDMVFASGVRLSVAIIAVAKAKTAHKATKEALEEANKEYGLAILEFKEETCEANNLGWFDA